MSIILTLNLHFCKLTVNFTKHSSFIYYILIDFWFHRLDAVGSNYKLKQDICFQKSACFVDF